MADYHKKLVITQNISLALKITDELPEQSRAQSQVTLVEALTKDVNHLLSGQYLPIESTNRSRENSAPLAVRPSP